MNGQGRLTIFSAWLLSVGFLFSTLLWAEDSAPMQPLSLPQLIQQALQHNPGLQAKKRAYEAAKARVFTAWLPEDPEFGVDIEGQKSLFDIGSRTDTEYMVSQTILFPTKVFLRARLAAREAQMAFQRYKEEERGVAWHIEQPYYELFLAKHTVKTLEELHELSRQLTKAAQARYETNRVSQQDLLKAQIETSKISIEIFEWREKEHIAEAHFSHVLNRPLDSRYVLLEESSHPFPELSWPELEQLALKARPELHILQLGIERAKTNRTLALTQWLPDLTGRIEAREFHSGAESERDTFIGITVPVWSLLKGAGGEWKAAGKEVEEAEAMYHEMKNEVFLAIHQAYSKMRAANNAIRAYEDLILPQAKQQVEIALSAYEAGRADFLELIDAQRTLRETQLAYYRVKADYELGLSDLQLAIGGTWQ